MGTPSVPAAFADFDQLEGLDIADKAAFVGKPMGITAIRFRLNERGVLFVEAEVITADGEVYSINDSSTGVRDQLLRYHAEKTGEPLDVGDIEPGNATQWFPTRLYAARGLRVSSYDVTVDGKPKPSKTYYITTSGQHESHIAGATTTTKPRGSRAKDQPTAA